MFSNWTIFEHVHKRKMACHAKTQTLLLQMSLLKVDSVYARYALSMQTAVLFYRQPLNNGIFTTYKYFLRYPFLSMPIRILPVNKRLRNSGQIQLIAKSSSIYTKSCLGHTQQIFCRSWRKVCYTIFIVNTFR